MSSRHIIQLTSAYHNMICVTLHVCFSNLLVKIGHHCKAFCTSWPLLSSDVEAVPAVFTEAWSVMSFIQSSSKVSPCNHTLCSTQQAAISCGKSHTSMSFLLGKHLHCPLSQPYACPTAAHALLNL